MKISHILKLSKKRLVILVVILFVAILGFIFLTRPATKPEQFTQVKRGDMASTVSSSGTLTGKEVTDLKFKSAGRLAYLNVKTGDTVYAYQTIAGLDTKLLEIDLQQATNSLRDKQATAEKVEDDVKGHDKDETFKQKMDRTTAQVARDNAYDEVKAVQKALQEAHIYTPIAGIVTKAPFIPGQNVSASDLIVQVVNLSTVYFDTDVDEADIGNISLGQRAQVTVDAYQDQEFKGIVEQIIPQTKTTSSGATVVTVRIKLETPPANFIQALSGQSQIIITETQNSLIIPIEALKEDNMVVLQNGQGVKEVKVTTGIQSDTEVEIKEGLKEGDKVLLNPPANLQQARRGNSLFRIFAPRRS